MDVTEGIQKQVTVLYCKECGRYLQVRSITSPFPPRSELHSYRRVLVTPCVALRQQWLPHAGMDVRGTLLG